MRVAGLVSGGKDSIYALYKIKEQHEIVCMITFKSKRSDSYMFHIPNVDLVRFQAESMGLPLIMAESPGIKEKELEDIKKALKKAIKEYNIEGVVSGALASNYQKERIEKICKELKLASISPLWHVNPLDYINEMIENKFEVIITGIAAEGLNADFLGKKIDKEFLEKIKKTRIHIGGEGGEYESFVLDCPLFEKKIEVIKAEIKMENKCTGNCTIDEIRLVGK